MSKKLDPIRNFLKAGDVEHHHVLRELYKLHLSAEEALYGPSQPIHKIVRHMTGRKPSEVLVGKVAHMLVDILYAPPHTYT